MPLFTLFHYANSRDTIKQKQHQINIIKRQEWQH